MIDGVIKTLHPRGGYSNKFGATKGEQPHRLGEPQVIADEDSDSAPGEFEIMGWGGESENAIDWGERGIRLSPFDLLATGPSVDPGGRLDRRHLFLGRDFAP
jgi:hypothetical protein